jgi:hypothetical protein
MERVKGSELSSRFPSALYVAASEHFMNVGFRAFQQAVAFCSHFPFKSGE